MELRLPPAGSRNWSNGYYNNQLDAGEYWSSSHNTTIVYYFYFSNSSNSIWVNTLSNRADAYPIRCIKN